MKRIGEEDNENWDAITSEIVNTEGSIDTLLGKGTPSVPGKEESGAGPALADPPLPGPEVLPASEAVPEAGDTPAVKVKAEEAPSVVTASGAKSVRKKLVRKREGGKAVPGTASEEVADSSDKKVFFLLPQTVFFLFQCIVMGKGQKCSVVLRSLVEEYVKRNASVLEEVASRISGNG